MNCLLHLSRKQLIPSLTALVLVGFLCGCKTPRLSDPVTGGDYEPQNFYQAWPQFPAGIRRVAVLPTTGDANQSAMQSGQVALGMVLLEELGKTKKFEVVTVSSEQMRTWTGRSHWRAEETLPPNLFQLLQTELGCDAVLFSRLTQYRAYPPLAVGFSLKLAELKNAEILWAADEVFDATEPRVVNSARRYQLTREQLPTALADSRSILNSPTGFGRYAASRVFETLPQR